MVQFDAILLRSACEVKVAFVKQKVKLIHVSRWNTAETEKKINDLQHLTDTIIIKYFVIKYNLKKNCSGIFFPLSFGSL